MDNVHAVSPLRMAVLVLVFTTSSTIIFIPSSLLSESGNAFWIAWFLAGVCGMLLLLCMLYLHTRFPDSTLVEFGKHTVGAGASTVLLLPYVVFTLLLSAYIFYSVGTFFTTTMMKETPTVVFNGLLAAVCLLTARSGLAAISRMFTLLNVILIGSIIMVLVLSSTHYHPEFLLPVLPFGWRPVFHSVYQVAGFVYGDFIVFAMLFGFMRTSDQRSYRPILIAFVFNWCILLAVCFGVVMAFGPMTQEFQYPLFSLARVISIQEIIERGESVMGMSLVVGSFMKSTLTLYAASTVISRLAKVKDDRLLLVPVTFIGFTLSLVIVKNESEYAEALLIWPLITLCASMPIWVFAAAAAIRRRNRV